MVSPGGVPAPASKQGGSLADIWHAPPCQRMRLFVARSPTEPTAPRRSLSRWRLIRMLTSGPRRRFIPQRRSLEINLFAGDPVWRARWGAAANPRCPPELLERLASDMSPNVCAAVASNPASSPELLQQLRTETQWPVPVSLAGNPNTATEILAELADRDTITQSAVASNPSTDRDTLWHLARSHDIDVRRGVALNPLCPPDILQKLVSDNDYRVVETAGAHPSYDGPIPYSPRYDEP